ncbi:MAG: YggS family pyridoxal phosphate-dependent enzyme [Rhodothermales bacterium]|nr:YggS family pyridoxal phosphate-dependent enzyme [Rhodothermales bacterium]
MTTSAISPRVGAIRERIAEVHARIEAACRRAGRDAESVRLIAVTKTFPVEVVRAAVAAGLSDFGENRVQELVEKAESDPGAYLGGTIRWHLIGPLQRNKAKSTVETADVFHALDSDRLAKELEKRAAREGRVLPCFVQVNVSGEATKSGVQPAACHAFLDRLQAYEHLRIVGLMTLAAPAETDEELEAVVRPQFRRLHELAESYDGGGRVRPDRLSMGMSGDFEVAVEEGATDIRLGSALFGPRPAP